MSQTDFHERVVIKPQTGGQRQQAVTPEALRPIYCYSEQLKAVRVVLWNLFEGMDQRRIVGVDAQNCDQMQGQAGGNFVVIDRHPHPVPHEVLLMIAERGFHVWSYNDQHVRDRYSGRRK
jgi:hypothetical protein